MDEALDVAFFDRWPARMMPINIFGSFIVLLICLSDVSGQRQKCLGSFIYCPGQFRAMGSVCRDGYCVCTGQDYDYNTCFRKLFCVFLIIYVKYPNY